MAYFCSNPWTTVFVWSNGDVTHCCYSNTGPLGNINRDNLAQIWSGAKINAVRKQVLNNDYVKAGCEHFCRAFRWNRYYGEQDEIPEISEGLGRLTDFTPPNLSPTPAIIGIELNGNCNFRCAHCLASKSNKGLTDKNIEDLWPYLKQARIIRIVGGEFTINPRSLEVLSKIGELPAQPVVFMNTNGHLGLDRYFSYIQNIHRFHLKFSLEGLKADYNRIRVGGDWENFQTNLLRARDVFRARSLQGKDWRLYLNFCVMRTNFLKLPEVIRFAVEQDVPLVVNPVNGMRHIHENIFMYEHLGFAPEEIEQVVSQSHRLIDSRPYLFSRELKQHLDYVIRALRDRKLRISPQLLELILKLVKGQKADRLLYIYYKWRLDRKACFVYLFRKVKKRLHDILYRKAWF